MAVQTWLKGFCRATGQWLGLSVTPEGSVSVVAHGANYENYYTAAGSVTTGTNVSVDLWAALGRRANAGYFTVDGAGDIAVYIDGEHNSAITVKTGEVLFLDGANAAMLVLSTSGTDIAYRLLAK